MSLQIMLGSRFASTMKVVWRWDQGNSHME